MSQEEIPKTKEELLQRIDRSRTALEKAISTLGPEELSEILPGGWSIKDHLAHLAAWELGVAELLRHRPRFVAMGVEEAIQKEPSEDELNDILFQRHAGMTVSEALDFFHEAHAQMLAALEALENDAALFRPYRDYAAGASSEAEDPPNDPVIHWIIGNTYEHFDLHRGYISE